MKSSILIFSILLSTACTSTVNSNDTELDKNQEKPLTILEGSTSEEVKQAIALANQNNDYRLLVTSGRSMSIPGVKATDYDTVTKLCGKKYNPATGDVISSQEQRLAHKQEINFMRQYNEQILILCQEYNRK